MNYTVDDYIKTLKYISSFLDNEKKAYVFLKSYRIGVAYSDSNIDVLLSQEDTLWYKQHLVSLGFKETYSYKEPEKSMMQHEDYKVSIHLHHRISRNGIDYLDAGEVIVRRRKKELHKIMVPVESPEDHILIHLAHMFHENYRITRGEYEHLVHYTAGEDLQQELMLERARYYRREWVYTYMYHLLQMRKVRHTYNIPLMVLIRGFYHKIWRDGKEGTIKSVLRGCLVFPLFYAIVKTRRGLNQIVTVPTVSFSR